MNKSQQFFYKRRCFFENSHKRVKKRKKHYTQEIADKLGVTKSYISYVESGKIGIMLENASEIADFLNVTLDELAGRERKEN